MTFMMTFVATFIMRFIGTFMMKFIKTFIKSWRRCAETVRYWPAGMIFFYEDMCESFAKMFAETVTDFNAIIKYNKVYNAESNGFHII